MSKLDILDKYDYNIYVVDGEVILSAYRQCYQEYKGVRELTTDTRNYTSLQLPLTDDYLEENQYLLGLDDLSEVSIKDLEEFDDWVLIEYLTRGETPAIIKSYLEHLPDYELE